MIIFGLNVSPTTPRTRFDRPLAPAHSSGAWRQPLRRRWLELPIRIHSMRFAKSMNREPCIEPCMTLVLPFPAIGKALISSMIRQVVLIVQVFEPWRTHQEHCRIVFRGKSEAHGVRASPMQPPTRNVIAPTPQQELVTPIFWTLVVGKLHLDDKRWVQRCPSYAIGARYWFVEKLRVFHPLFKRMGKRSKSAGLVTALAVCMKRRPV